MSDLLDFYNDPLAKRYRKKTWGDILGIPQRKKSINKIILGPFRRLNPFRQWQNFKERVKRRIGLRSEFYKAYRRGNWGQYMKRKIFDESLIMPFEQSRLLETGAYGVNISSNDDYQTGPTNKGMFHKLSQYAAPGAVVGLALLVSRKKLAPYFSNSPPPTRYQRMKDFIKSGFNTVSDIYKHHVIYPVGRYLYKTIKKIARRKKKESSVRQLNNNLIENYYYYPQQQHSLSKTRNNFNPLTAALLFSGGLYGLSKVGKILSLLHKPKKLGKLIGRSRVEIKHYSKEGKSPFGVSARIKKNIASAKHAALNTLGSFAALLGKKNAGKKMTKAIQIAHAKYLSGRMKGLKPPGNFKLLRRVPVHVIVSAMKKGVKNKKLMSHIVRKLTAMGAKQAPRVYDKLAATAKLTPDQKEYYKSTVIDHIKMIHKAKKLGTPADVKAIRERTRDLLSQMGGPAGAKLLTKSQIDTLLFSSVPSFYGSVLKETFTGTLAGQASHIYPKLSHPVTSLALHYGLDWLGDLFEPKVKKQFPKFHKKYQIIVVRNPKQRLGKFVSDLSSLGGVALGLRLGKDRHIQFAGGVLGHLIGRGVGNVIGKKINRYVYSKNK